MTSKNQKEKGKAWVSRLRRGFPEQGKGLLHLKCFNLGCTPIPSRLTRRYSICVLHCLTLLVMSKFHYASTCLTEARG